MPNTESMNSNFENQLRQSPHNPSPIFKKNNQWRIPKCIPSKQKIESTPDSSNPFPNLNSETEPSVLDCSSNSIPHPTQKNIAVLFSGGPAPGGHNVIAGIFDLIGKSNTLFGVISGPKGLIEGNLIPLTKSKIDHYRNLGGFHMLGSDRTKIKSDSQFNAVKKTVQKYKLDGLIIIGGDDSNTNAAFLANYLNPLNCHVCGVPKTIDGDLQEKNLLPISFGFDTATKIYAEMVGNILQDSASSKKYWHFIKLMGRSASHVTLEVALQTHPPITLISEDIQHQKWSLDRVASHISGIIIHRHLSDLPYGVCLIPEGLIEFIPELNTLIQNLNTIFGNHPELNQAEFNQKIEAIQKQLSKPDNTLLNSLPKTIQETLLLDRDDHGNLKVSQIPTENLIMTTVEQKINQIKKDDFYQFFEEKIQLTPSKKKQLETFQFSPLPHFFGYEGRCGAPSQFDAQFTYNLGLMAATLILNNKTGYIASISNLESDWTPLGIYLPHLIHSEIRQGKPTHVIQKCLVSQKDPAFVHFKSIQQKWAQTNSFSAVGPRQYPQPKDLQSPLSTQLNTQK